MLAEFIGTAGLLIAVVGSCIMGEALAQGNLAIALLANSIATGAALYALIQCFSGVSGAHFNPVVSLVEWLWKRLTIKELLGYVMMQLSGAIVGVFVTHAMFGQRLLQFSSRDRGGFRFIFSEVVATFGLIVVISLAGKKNVGATPFAIAAYVMAAYWFTSSTSFANPAVTVARCLTDTFSGILWTGSLGFILAQIMGALVAYKMMRLF